MQFTRSINRKFNAKYLWIEMSAPVVSFGGRLAGPKPYELEDTHGNFNVDWTPTPGKYYTIGLYDISTSPPYIHYLVVNRIDNDPGRIIVSYYRPNPPTGVHEYYFDIYEQPGYLEQPNPAVLRLVGRTQFKVSAKRDGHVKPDPTPEQEKWCRCVLEVAAKGNNPYAVCSKSVGTSYRKCTENYYDFPNMPLPQLQAYADLHHLTISPDRTEQLKTVEQYKYTKYGIA